MHERARSSGAARPPDFMHDVPPGSRLHHCIRDLATLNALPNMCIGRNPDEALDIVMDALPTALSCELVHLRLHDGTVRASLRGMPVGNQALAVLTRALTREPDANGVIAIDQPQRLWCLAVDVPIGSARGELVAGKSAPLDLDLDRVLVRCAANLVGTTLETANVLEAAKHKDEFIAMLGHELRNPLAPILTAVELLAQHAEVSREREIIDRHTRHLARLVDDLLDISRVERGHIELRQEPVALNEVLDGALELASHLITGAQHELIVTRAADVLLEGDPIRLALPARAAASPSNYRSWRPSLNPRRPRPLPRAPLRRSPGAASACSSSTITSTWPS